MHSNHLQGALSKLEKLCAHPENASSRAFAEVTVFWLQKYVGLTLEEKAETLRMSSDEPWQLTDALSPQKMIERRQKVSFVKVWFWRMYPRSGFHSRRICERTLVPDSFGETSECTLVPVFVPLPKKTFLKPSLCEPPRLSKGGGANAQTRST